MKKRLKYISDSIRDLFVKTFTSRVAIVGIVFVVMFCIIIARLFYLQIIKAEDYQDNFTLMSKKVIYSEGARGNIYDCNGKIIAHNEVSYSVFMTDEIKSSSTKGETINNIIYQTIKIIEENGDSIIDDFNIAFENGKAVFKEDPITPTITFLVNVFGIKSSEIYEKGYDKYTAEEIIDYMCSDKRFDVNSEKYTLEERIKICTVRYALSLNSYQKYISTEIATNINEYTQAAIMECKSDLIGVDVKETYKRIYDYGLYYGSILGYTGSISEGELESYNNNDLGVEYQAGDIVGKTGIESSYDAYLKGTKGTETVFVDSKGSILEVVDSKKSGSGNDLYLTLDTDLQIAYYEILEREIAGLLVAQIVNWDYVSDGTDEIVYIPANDVYYQLLTNVCVPLKFSDPDASQREKSVYKAFLEKRKNVLAEIESQLNNPDAPATGELSADFNEYMYTAYGVLRDNGILNKDVMDTSDSVYVEFVNEEISLREFLIHAIAQNWIDVSLLDSSKKYATSDEIYADLVVKLIDILTDYSAFQNNIYYYMVYSGEISAYDICMMLYDQGALEDDDNKVLLEEGYIAPYEYIIRQITNLTITPAMVALDPCSGSFVMTDTKTKKIIALVSYPSYDNNQLSGRIDSDYWYQLNNDDSSPLFNRATQALSAPGSTFKPISAAAGLNEGVIDLDTFVYDDGVFTEITPSPKCWIYPGSHEYVNVITALTDSCNYFFYSVGYWLSLDSNGKYTSLQGLDYLEQYATNFGLNMKSGVEIEETAPRFSSTDSVRTAIGQGTSGFSTVQLARYVTCLANKGNNYNLSIVDHVDDKSGERVLTVEPVLNNTVELDDSYWNAIYAGMRGVVTDGSVRSIFSDCNVVLAGKTGTAQESIYRSNHSNFIGFAPYSDAEVAFACTIRNGGSASYAAETTKDCIEYYYGYTGLEDILQSGAKDIELEGVTD